MEFYNLLWALGPAINIKKGTFIYCQKRACFLPLIASGNILSHCSNDKLLFVRLFFCQVYIRVEQGNSNRTSCPEKMLLVGF